MSFEGRVSRDRPHYALDGVSEAFRRDRFEVPGRVVRHMRSCGWDREFVRDCVLDIRLDAFHKSVPHRDRAGVWLDIYRPQFRGEHMYVKIAAHEREGWFLVLSFCIDGHAH